MKFIFQPAEEGAPDGEEGGAALMIRKACWRSRRLKRSLGCTSRRKCTPAASATGPARSWPARIVFASICRGVRRNGAQPWSGVDPIVVGSQIVLGLQTIVSRKVNLTEEPAVVTVGAFHSGNRNNIIPDKAKMEGTVRAFDEKHREEIHGFIDKIATLIAESGGAKAKAGNPEGLSGDHQRHRAHRMVRTGVEACGGGDERRHVPEDLRRGRFCVLPARSAGLFINLVAPARPSVQNAPSNHSPLFYVDECSLVVGVKAMAMMAVSWLGEQGG